MEEKISPEELKNLFLEIIQKSDKFTFLNGTQPFLITFSSKPYYIYIKHLSSAYFKDRPDTTRAQLPVRPDFDEIKKSTIPFIFLGYDIQNDVYVCWNYNIAKNRLNEKESVSFYSRESFQKQVVSGSFLRKKLKNDDIPVLFKREDLISFFENIENFFVTQKPVLADIENNKTYKKDGKLYKITESELLEKIHLLVNEKTNKILEAISVSKEFYGDKYPNMKYSDWSNLVKSTSLLYSKNSNSQNYTNLSKKKTILEQIIEIMTFLGGKASYKEIYKKYEELNGITLTNGQKAGIRATIERNSADSKNFRDKDIFYSVNGKGSGVWGLNSMR